jgi:hypothetical protein
MRLLEIAPRRLKKIIDTPKQVMAAIKLKMKIKFLPKRMNPILVIESGFFKRSFA